MTKHIHQILIRPILTEKSVRLAGNRKYTFEVALDATKPEIAGAIETLYEGEKVKVGSVNTMHVRAKTKRVLGKRGRRGGSGSTSEWKKAIVTLTSDSGTIPELEGA
jgi:large subunit ribosomal protein L23